MDRYQLDEEIAHLWTLGRNIPEGGIFPSGQLNFASISDANRLIKSKLHQISGRFDLIVGVPRSGLMLASIIALHLNLRLISLDQLNTVDIGNFRLSRSSEAPLSDCTPLRVLVVDDSVHTGAAMRRAREFVARLTLKWKIRPHFLGIYVCPEVVDSVDSHFALMPQPRAFEWNFVHHAFASSFLFDMDGVICEDGPAERSEDQEPYINHLLNARPKIIPKQKIGAVVTSRLEKYRQLTSKWLDGHGIKYDHLVMLDLPSAENRRALAIHAKFKAHVYLKLGGRMFVESETWQAKEIARITRRPVYNLQESIILTE